MPLKRRRNFLLTFILNLFLWLLWFDVVFNISPDQHFSFFIFHFSFDIPFSLILFFFTLTLSLTLTLAFIFSNTRKGFLTSLFITGFLLLRLIKQAYPLNILLLIGIIVCLELYFSRKNKNP